MLDRVRKGDFKGGLGVFARFVPFPSILARLCNHPCESSCERSDTGDSVRIGALERACVDFGGPAPALRKMTEPPGESPSLAAS
jgi:NADPH-dependent glutamate synthase beta subunit-like oxidoreductase